MKIVKELMDKWSTETAGHPPVYTAAIITGGYNVSMAIPSM